MEVETETEDTADTYTPVTAVRIWKKQYPKYKVVIIFLVLLLMVVVIFLAIGLSVSRGYRRGHVIRYEASTQMFRFSSVQAPTETCREIAVVIQTKYGGGAVDAAIAAAFCSGVVAIDASGLGGSLAAVVHKPSPSNSSEEGPLSVVAQATAPQLANRLMFYNHPNPHASSQGGLSVAVPGEVAGLYSLWCQFGTLPWADLVAPSILLLQNYIDTNNTQPWPNRQSTGNAQQLDTEVPSLRLPLLLQTLLTVSADPMSFYNGTLADDIAADIQDNGGIISADDLAAYQPLFGPALSLHLPEVNLSLHTTPPPSGGSFVNHVVNRFNSYHRNHTVSEDCLGQLYSEMVDAFKAGFSKLLRWDSSEHKDLTSIHDGADVYPEGYEEAEDNISNDITVIGVDGTCVVITLSLYSRFGSRVVGAMTGILFNNAMSSFTIIKDQQDFDTTWHNHHISPRAMSRSYMAPVLSTDNSHQVLLASAGGAAVTALTGLTQVLHYWLYRNKTLEKSVGLPRMHYNPANGHLIFENGFDWQYLSDYVQHNNYPKTDFILHSAAVDAVLVLRHQTLWSRDWWDRKYIYVISDGRHDTAADGRHDTAADERHDTAADGF